MTELIEETGISESVETFGCEGKPIRVERFEPEPDGVEAAVLLLHGADGLHVRGPAYREMARDLARNGFLGLLIHYFDSTGNVAASPLHFLRWIEAVEDAIEYAVRQPGLAVPSAGLVGFSLGAHLALAVAAQDSRVGAVVDCFGGLPDLDASRVHRLPPVLILHGEADTVVPVEEAHKLQQLLDSLGLPYEMRLFPGQGHNLQGPAAREAFQHALAFLEQHLKDGPDGTPLAQESRGQGFGRKG
jgi:carboxymethylenebutenolidase